MSKQLLDEILRLPIDQRLELVERVWDSIAASPESIPVPEWHKEVLDRRLGQDPEERTWLGMNSRYSCVTVSSG
jgi:putative addiction module component (TIGR02574 family)